MEYPIVQGFHPFGMVMPGRNFNNADYRFGFNGKENDNEIKGGNGDQQDYGMRMYDPRIAKFLSVDPLAKMFPYYSVYQFAGNKPIWCLDLDGTEDVIYTQITLSDGTSDSKQIFSDDDLFIGLQLQASQLLGVPMDQLPKSGSLSIVGTQDGFGESPMIHAAYMPAVDVSPDNTVVEDVSAFMNDLDKLNASWYGEKGMKKFGSDLASGSTWVKAAGVGVTICGAPELGVSLYEFGNTLDNGAKAINLISDVNSNDGFQVANDLVWDFGGKLAGDATSDLIKNQIQDETKRMAVEGLVDYSLDVAKDQESKAIENLDKPKK